MNLRSVATTARLYFDTLRTLRAEQIAFRVMNVARERSRSHGFVPERPWLVTPPPALVRLRDRVEATALRAASDSARVQASAALAHRFEFGDFTMSTTPPIDWSPPAASRLARYHLHYLDALEPLAALAANGDADAHAVGDELVAAWSAGNALAVGGGWEPYPASTRLINLIAWSLVSDQVSRELLAQHARWVSWHFERHLLGNHLLRNLTALALAGLRFEGAEARGWLRRSLRFFERELADQILTDGGHHERSPMYHLIVLDDLLRVVALARRAEVTLPPFFDAAVRRMAIWARSMRHPDGEIPLFNDAAFGQASHPSEVLAFAAAVGLAPAERCASPWRAALWAGHIVDDESAAPAARVDHEASGYSIVRDGDDVLFFDHGPIGPSHLLGHAHSDTLGFELSVRGVRIAVDGGVSGYDADPLRGYLRSASAHSVVTVNGQGPDELWKTFRVARRSKPGPHRSFSRDGITVHQASVRAPFGWLHERTLIWLRSTGLVVLDHVVGTPRDAAVCAQVQLHPDVSAITVPDGFDLRRGEAHVRARLLADSIALGEGPVAERFARPRTTTHLRYRLRATATCHAAAVLLDWNLAGERVQFGPTRIVVRGERDAHEFYLRDNGWRSADESAP